MVKEYVINVDASVLKLVEESFPGVTSDDALTFNTKSAPPSKNTARLAVAPLADAAETFS
jgi:hypothetical protein